VFDRRGFLGYNNIMFSITPCAAGCGRASVTGSRICAVHSANPQGESERITAFIGERKTVKDLNAPGLHFDSIDFSRRRFFGCNFKGASFSMCLFTESVMRMNFFDFTVFHDCDFSRSDIQFLSFAGSTVRNCTFEGSELVNINFGGAVLSDCTFNNSDLYNSRFIGADIELCDFVNCNLKRTYFIGTRQEGVSFKSSNTAEAVFAEAE
jgi:uncharacterized protein YjbI with pentapeptide repeats